MSTYQEGPDENQATIVIDIDWRGSKKDTIYSVYKRADLCDIPPGDPENPEIYIKKKENSSLEIFVRFRANRPIEYLGFIDGTSEAEPPQYHQRGECGPGFELTETIDPDPEDDHWHAIVKNDAEDPKEGFELKVWLKTENGTVPIDPRVYNHGHMGDGGLLKRLLALIQRLIQGLKRRFQ